MKFTLTACHLEFPPLHAVSPTLATAWHHLWKVKAFFWVVQPAGLAGSTDFHQDIGDPVSGDPVSRLHVIRCFEPRIVYMSARKSSSRVQPLAQIKTLWGGLQIYSLHNSPLVGGLEHYLFFHSVGNGMIIPIDELIYFSQGLKTTTNTIHIPYMFTIYI